jgi:hypothetical protein
MRSLSKIFSQLAGGALVLTLGSVVYGQALDQKSERGLLPGRSYAFSDVETISTSSGNVLLHVPITSLPAGRAGHTAGVTLIYNSKQWDAASTLTSCSGPGRGPLTSWVLSSEQGGWKYAYGYCSPTAASMR